MAVDDGGVTRDRRIDVEIANVVQQVNAVRAYADRFGQRQIARPCIVVVVSADRMGRRDFTETLQHLRRADVAGMEDEVTTTQRSERFFPDEAMRVGDDANLFVRMSGAGNRAPL